MMENGGGPWVLPQPEFGDRGYGSAPGPGSQYFQVVGVGLAFREEWVWVLASGGIALRAPGQPRPHKLGREPIL